MSLADREGSTQSKVAGRIIAEALGTAQPNKQRGPTPKKGAGMISALVPPDLRDALVVDAEKRGVTMSALVRELLAERYDA